ncbi:MAG: DegT/DnrJ/EryC1/StrS family aminotransferase [Flavobacteriales bacterium]|nr:DegT/DnrJ/EryC1/StrS family aminotransferase [Flavobacteriales bacterium]
MNTIQVVDLKNQYLKIQSEIDEAVLEVVRSCAYINGPAVKEFQADLERYLGVKHVIPCANGTDALQIALMSLDLSPGDEVITPSFTYIATSEVAAVLGLRTVFVDVDEDTFTIDPSKLETLINEKTKAIIPVHLYGQCSNMEEIMAIAKKRNIAVIEDTAQAIGADYTFKDNTSKKAGTIGDIGTTSFFPSKNLGCYGDGGAIFTNSDDLAEKIRMIANHGQKKRYFHDVIGVNSRLDSIQAAVLKVKLKYLDEYCEARRKAAQSYSEAFAKLDSLQTPKVAPYTSHVYHQYTLKLDEGISRDAFQAHLKERGIPSNVYYPLPNHMQKGFLNSDHFLGDLSVTMDLKNRVVSLPIHTELEDAQVDYIISTITEYLESIKISA